MRAPVLVELDAGQTAAGVGGIGGDHLSRGRAGGVHPFVIEDDGHLPPRGFLDRDAHEVHHTVGHPANVAWQADARVDDKAVDAVGLEVGDLTHYLILIQGIVPEPERRQTELAGWVPEGRHSRDLISTSQIPQLS